jgi:hypothetical protein
MTLQSGSLQGVCNVVDLVGSPRPAQAYIRLDSIQYRETVCVRCVAACGEKEVDFQSWR